jgi:hypothetical protein
MKGLLLLAKNQQTITEKVFSQVAEGVDLGLTDETMCQLLLPNDKQPY